MHDLQTIIKLNRPLTQREPALAEAYQIARDTKVECAVPYLDRVLYGAPPRE